jgi:fructose-bisphosphate aldolase class I
MASGVAPAAPQPRALRLNVAAAHTASLLGTMRALVAEDKGLLAMDESVGTCNLCLASAGIAQTAEARRDYRELLLSAPGLGESISGVILADETIHQSTTGGTPFLKVLDDAGILAGIKVDTGTTALAEHPGEKITEGLDGLRARLQAYAAMGARFTQWRAVICADGSGREIPSPGGIQANAHALARYAALSQEAGLVPIVEPEVLIEGRHTLERCQAVTQTVLHAVFEQLRLQRVILETLILKPNMVLPDPSNARESLDAIADASLHCLLRAVPAAVPAIAFLSGGQPSALASARLNAMHVRFGSPKLRTLPWALTFSFARALQQPALQVWAGRASNRLAAQEALLHRARCNRAAVRGAYHGAMDATASEPAAPHHRRMSYS